MVRTKNQAFKMHNQFRVYEARPSLRVIYEENQWVPPAERRSIEEEADITRWWLQAQGCWQNSSLTISKTVLDDETGTRSMAAYPILDHPNQPIEQQDVCYYLGFDGNIYTYDSAQAGLITFDPEDGAVRDEVDHIVEKLRLTRDA